MRRKSFSLALCGLVIIFTGCSATGPRLDSVQSSIPTLKEGTGRVYFYREYASFGAGMRPDIYLCDKKVGESIPGGVFYVDAPSGDCDASIPTVLYGGERKLKVTIQPRKELFIRTWIGGSGFGGRTNMEVVPESRARDAIKNLALTK